MFARMALTALLAVGAAPARGTVFTQTASFGASVEVEGHLRLDNLADVLPGEVTGVTFGFDINVSLYQTALLTTLPLPATASNVAKVRLYYFNGMQHVLETMTPIAIDSAVVGDAVILTGAVRVSGSSPSLPATDLPDAINIIDLDISFAGFFTGVPFLVARQDDGFAEGQMFVNYTYTPTDVPEPTSMVLLGAGAFALGAASLLQHRA